MWLNENKLKRYMQFKRLNGGIIELHEEVIRNIYNHRQTGSGDNESCGVLIGWFEEQTSNIFIDFITIPGELDIVWRHGYFRKDPSHNQIVSMMNEDSKYKYTYIGEWHTHPSIDVSPSCIDKKYWRKIIKEGLYYETIIFLIAGIEQTRIWEVVPNTNNIKELAFIEE